MNTKKIIVLCIVLIGIIAAGFIIYSFSNYHDAAPQTSNQQRAEDIKNSVPEKDSDTNSSGLPVNNDGTSDNVPVDETMSVSISSFSQSNGLVKASAATSVTGTCVFQYTTPDDKPVVDQQPSINNACSSSISEVSFSKLGSWQLKVTLYSDGKKIEDTKDVSIN